MKILFLDIDWTLLDHDAHEFDKKSIQFINELHEKGLKVFICTARPFHSIKRIGLLDMLQIDGIIAVNGGLVIIHNKIIYQNSIPQSIAEQAINILLKHNVTAECVEAYDRFLIAEKTDYVDKLYNVYSETIPPVRTCVYKDIISILAFTTPDNDETLKNELPDELAFTRFDTYGVDLAYGENQKGTGVKAVLDYYKISKENAIAAGDDIGDIDMFKNVGISIAVGNAKDEVKNAATIVTKSVAESGVYHALKSLKLDKNI